VWQAVAGIVALLAAGITFWLKRASDNPPEVRVQLENDLQRALESVKLLKGQLDAMRLINSGLERELIEERLKNVRGLDAAGAAERLRRPER
jgi:hypothetical protein